VIIRSWKIQFRP